MRLVTTPAAPPDRLSNLRRLVLRLTAAFAGLLVLALAATLLWGWLAVRGSLPLVDQSVALAGLSAPVRVERDARGVPTLRGASRVDVARATGFVHAQERFFQMDLQRRSAAGELAALIGPALREEDRRVRVHRFRALAAQVMEAAPADSRALIKAYSDGVNAGLAALRRPPFEYLALRTTPEPWRPEDTVLTLYAMFLQLQDDGGRREIALGVLHDTMPQAMFDFLAPRGTEWDAPMVGGPIAMAPIPGPEVFDLRGSEAVARAPDPAAFDPFDRPIAGSNNWAVAGRRTADGGAIVANDMHLGLQIPNIWYRAALAWNEAGGERRVSGVTLPGTPVLVAGSTGAIAWGFTNAMGDWNDVVLIDVDPADPESYRTHDGPRRFTHLAETIRVKGRPDETLDVVETIWGPVIGRDPSGRPRVLRWVAHDPAGVNLELWRLESAPDLDAALALAPGLGIPAQNFVVADASGRIGWTIAGRIPRRAGFDGRLPGSWADGARRWDGWLDAAGTPRLVDPPEGILWSANARVVDGAALAAIGDDGYDLGARAGQIRDDLRALDRATPADMLKIQLDDRALFLDRWRALLEGVLDRAAAADAGDTGAASPRAEARRLLRDWDGHASIDSVAYRLVRGFHSTVSVDLFDALTERCRAADPEFRYGRIGQREGPLWALVSAQPAHLLNPRYADWDQQLLASFDRLLADLIRDGRPLAEKTWGRRNTAAIRHPLSLAVPQLGAWLDMPPDPLPGDDNMPRVQAPDMGPSERFAVSPGRETAGYLHMPGGQSGHPLSPHYRDSQDAWVTGEATPFLPGPAVETLILEPSGGGGAVQ
jgi:penicillin amidase